MNKIIVRRSIGGWLIGAALGVVIMLSEYVRMNYPFTGIAVVGFVIFISSVIQLLITTPRVIIDDEGISALSLGKRKFFWKDIRSAELKTGYRSGDVITLILYDNTQHSFILSGVNISTEKIYSEITANIREYGDISNQSATENEEEEAST